MEPKEGMAVILLSIMMGYCGWLVWQADGGGHPLFLPSPTTANIQQNKSPDDVTPFEWQQYCLYMAEKDKVTIQANRKFGDQGESLLSDARRAWVEPQLKKLVDHYLTSKGIHHAKVMGQICKDGKPYGQK